MGRAHRTVRRAGGVEQRTIGYPGDVYRIWGEHVAQSRPPSHNLRLYYFHILQLQVLLKYYYYYYYYYHHHHHHYYYYYY